MIRLMGEGKTMKTDIVMEGEGVTAVDMLRKINH
jgi:hypothetical protein